jgi:hypothetical protein
MSPWTGLPAAIALLALVAAVPRAKSTNPRWGLEAHLGSAWSAPLPVVVRQRGAPDLRFSARRESRSSETPLYYVVRARRDDPRGAWTIELVHHKVHLVAPHPEVESFGVSHGYNLVLLGRTTRFRGWHAGAAAGLVVAHPENTVRGRRLDERRGLLRAGYVVAGPAASATAGFSQPLALGFDLVTEARVTLAWARVPVAGGSADVPDAALHLAVGLGWSPGR